jgi:spermidine synthase
MSLISYLYPITLYQSHSKWNSSIIVQEVNGVRELYIDNILQSGIWFSQLWKKVIDEINLDCCDGICKVLLMGLGGGDVLKIIRKKMLSTSVDCIEIDPEIIHVACKYFGVTEDPDTTIYQSDAALFLYRSDYKKYDLIIVDLYQGDRIPQFVSKLDFVARIKNKIKNTGVVVFNYASASFNERKFSEFEGLLDSVYKSVQRFPVSGHMFFIAK